MMQLESINRVLVVACMSGGGPRESDAFVVEFDEAIAVLHVHA